MNMTLGIEPGDARLPANVDESIEDPWRWMHISQFYWNLFFGDVMDELLGDLEVTPVPDDVDQERCIL